MTEQNWIPVSERFPNHGEMAICCTAYFYEVLQYDAKSNIWFNSVGFHNGEYVTHWMPLPQPPKEVEG